MWTALSAPSLYGIFPYAGLKFYFYEEMKRHVPVEQKKNIMVKLVCGSVAGLLGQTFTYPLDVVRRQMQVNHFNALLNYIWKWDINTNYWTIIITGSTALGIKECWDERNNRNPCYDCSKTRMEAFIFRAEHQLLEGGKPCLCVFSIISCLSGYLSFGILLRLYHLWQLDLLFMILWKHTWEFHHEMM